MVGVAVLVGWARSGVVRSCRCLEESLDNGSTLTGCWHLKCGT